MQGERELTYDDYRQCVNYIEAHKGEGPHSEEDLLRWVSNWMVSLRMAHLGLVPVDPDGCVIEDDFAWKLP